MANSDIEFKKLVVEEYLKNGSLRRTAKNFGIHYLTLYRWVKVYKVLKDRFFVSAYKIPWNKTKETLEKEIVFLKEKNPNITIKNTQEVLRKRGIKVSCHAI